MTEISLLNTDILKELAAFEAPLCLTLTMPCIKSGDQQQQNAIRFKNLLQDATKKLEKIGCQQHQIDDLLSPLEPLLDEADFWTHLQSGLIVCVSEDKQGLYHLPFSIDENVIVDRHFYLRPVIPRLQQDSKVAVLLLSMNDPALIFSDRSSEHYETQVPPEPLSSFDDFMKTYDMEESLQFRSQGYGGGVNATTPGYHGQGVAGDDATKNAHLKEYLKQLENWVDDTLQQRHFKEVFLVAGPQLEGLYKTVMRSGGLQLHKLDQKNPSSEKPEIWIENVRQQLKERFEQESERALATYQRLKRKHEGSIEDNLPDIVRAAHSQRIETLMLPDKSQDYYWGRFDPDTSKIQEQEQDENVTGPGDELVNLAAIKTLLNGGRVIPMPEGASPDYAALCRW